MLETSLFTGYRVNYHAQNRLEKFRSFRETHAWLSSIHAKVAKLVLPMCAKLRDQRTKWIVLQFSERKKC